MKIWLITIGEPIPTDGKDVRLLKTGLFADWLQKKGHNVTFINSTFDHYKRKKRFEATKIVEFKKNYKIVLLWGSEYTKSISLQRFVNHKNVSRSFKKWLKLNREIPDIIICSYPTIELCKESIIFGNKNKIPVLVDVRDFWPDVFSEYLPSKIRWIGHYIFYFINLKVQTTLSKATNLSSMTETALLWTLKKAKRAKLENDFIFPFSYPDKSKTLLTLGKKNKDKHKIRMCFFGTIHKRSGLDLFIVGLSRLSIEEKKQITFNVAGTGSELERLKKLSRELDAPVKFLGWLEKSQIQSLMSNSNAGILAVNSLDFKLSIPNKIVEYLSGGLAIISCTEGEVKKFLEKNQCGFWVEAKPEKIELFFSNLIKKGIKKNVSDSALNAFNRSFTQENVFNKVEKSIKRIISKS